LPDANGSNGRPENITVGEQIRSTVSVDDAECDTADPAVESLLAPCRTFQFVAPGSGLFGAELVWADSSTSLVLLTPTVGKCCRSPLRVFFHVERGASYLFSVGYHGARLGAPDAAFEITTHILDVPQSPESGR
jgi:hypothetical protein